MHVPLAPSHEVRREGVNRMLSIPERVRRLGQIAEDLEAVALLWRQHGGLEGF